MSSSEQIASAIAHGATVYTTQETLSFMVSPDVATDVYRAFYTHPDHNRFILREPMGQPVAGLTEFYLYPRDPSEFEFEP